MLLKANRLDLVFKLINNMEIVESSDYRNLQGKYSELGIGEISVIASAAGRIAFIEDRRAEKVAEKEGLRHCLKN